MTAYFSSLGGTSPPDLSRLAVDDVLHLIVPRTEDLEAHRASLAATPATINAMMDVTEAPVHPRDRIDRISTDLAVDADDISIRLSARPVLVWPGAEDGVLQAFHHVDWPGAFGSVNLAPAYWNDQPATAAQVALRARLLPALPVRLTGAPEPTTLTRCTECQTRVDRRFAFGHSERRGKVVLRAGTDEVIAHVGGAARMISRDGSYCLDCIEGAFSVGALLVPRGLAFDHRAGRSVPPDRLGAWRLSDLPVDDPFDPVRLRYGRQALEWQTLELEPDCAARLVRLDAAP